MSREWHVLGPEEALAELGGDPLGLAPAEAARRRALHGDNELRAERRTSPLAILRAQLANVLILVLLAAIALSAVLGHALEAGAIFVIVVFAVALGFAQEYRAERSLEALRRLAAPAATVLRAGEELRVAARELVPGDVLLLHAGDRIAADGRLLEAKSLQVEEAALTGESVPVEKNEAALAAGPLPLGDRKNMVFAGTLATYGRGRAVVVATGAATEVGRIAKLLDEVEPTRTPLQQNLDRIGKALARAAAVVVVVIVALGLFRGQPWVEMLVFGVALAVAVVPEALPAVVTISLALGVQRLVKRNALVRRLAAAETLGSTSVICSDKTGTLTKDEMTVRALLVAGRPYRLEGAGYVPEGALSLAGQQISAPPLLLELLRGAVLASDASLVREGEAWRVRGDPTEGALVVAAAKLGLHKHELDRAAPRLAEIPFTSESKRMTTLHRDGEELVAYVKGAPETVLAACVHVATDAGLAPCDAAARAELEARAAEMAGQALRVLAVAKKPGTSLADAEQGLTLLGLVGMLDPPRPEAKEALARCREAGIKAVMITGDHPVTARAIAAELGLLQGGRVLTGAELAALSDERLGELVLGIDVYARVSPADKLRVVTALQAHRRVVAMTGDGVNDAPALKRADIGVAMGITGTDVSREAAAMTLTDDNFASIVGAVEEGRAIYGNIKKYLMYLLSSNIGEIGLMAGASLLGLPLPLTAVQLLYVNLATDGLPALALALDPPERDLMRRPPRPAGQSIFTRPVVALMLTGGIWSMLVNLGLFAWALRSGRSAQEAMTMSFVALVLVQFTKAYSFRSEEHALWVRPFANRWLNAAVAWEIALLLLLVYLPILHAPFNTFALTGEDWLVVGLVAASVIPVLELAKLLVRRGGRRLSA